MPAALSLFSVKRSKTALYLVKRIAYDYIRMYTAISIHASGKCYA